VRVAIEPDAEAAARFAARRVAEQIRRKPDSVLALATGSTMVPVYRALVELSARERLSFARASAFNLDEYVGLGVDDAPSFRRFLRQHLLDRVDSPPARHDAPDGGAEDLDAECRRYEAAIAAAGGIDLALLGLGRNGHLAFNEPGASLASRTRVELLMRETHAESRPRLAITMGMATLLEARACLLVALGPDKARAAAAMVEGPISAQLPASALQLHPDAVVVLDEEAAARLGRAQYYREQEAMRREREARRSATSVSHAAAGGANPRASGA
jgi:glucosamine-6-phosphate deaminase